MMYSVSLELLRGKVINSYKEQWVKDKATLELIKSNIEQFNQRTNFLVTHLINELSIKLEPDLENKKEELKFLKEIKNNLEINGNNHSPIESETLQKFQNVTEFKSIIALMNNRNNFCAIYQKVLNYLEKGSKNPSSITINNITAVIAAYSKVTSAESFMDKISYYPSAVKDVSDFLTEIEGRSKFMAEFVSKSPMHHRSYEILNEMNAKIFWYEVYNGMTNIYGEIFSKDFLKDILVENSGVADALEANLAETQLGRLKGNLRELTIPVIANHKFSNQKIKSFLFDLIENIVDEKKLFSKKLEEKEFLINVVELVELNPDLDINILAPYVATLLNQKNISLDSELIKRYYQNTLMPFVNYIKQKNFSVLKQDIIDEITNKERVHKFTNSFSKTDLELLVEKVGIILKRTSPEISGLDSDDYAFNYFLQDKAPWLPNHISQAKSVLITKRLHRHHELVNLKNILAEIKTSISTIPEANIIKKTKIKELYKKVAQREKESLQNLYKEEIEGIQYILSIDLESCKGFEAQKALCEDLIVIINDINLYNHREIILDKLNLFILDLENKLQQSKGLFINDPHMVNLKAIHNSVENLRRYLQGDYNINSADELYTDMPIEALPYGRYINEKNKERRQKNWEDQHGKLTEALQVGCQNYTDYLLNMNLNLFSGKNKNSNLNDIANESRKILDEIKDKEDVSIERIYDRLSGMSDNRMHLMLMYSAGKMQLFSNKVLDVINIAKESPDLSSASQPLAFFAKYGQHKLFNNPFGMLYNFYISYRMNNYSKYLTDFSNQEPEQYRMYEIINHHASSSALTAFTIKFFKIYKNDILSLIKKMQLSDIITDKIRDGFISDFLRKLDIKQGFDSIIIDKLKNMLDLPISGEYGELTDHEKVEEYLNNQVSNIIDNLNPELMSFNEDKIINHLIELKDLSRKTGIYISDAMIKGILASYNKNYANPDAEEFKAFDTIFASEGIIDGPSLQYDVPEYSFLFKLVKINKVSSLLDNNKINTILNIMDNDSPNFSNVELSLRDIDEDIPGSSVLDKRSFLVDLLKRRAGITLANINKYSSSIDPEAPAFNYFSQENIVYLPFRYMSVISSDLAKRFKKHVDIMENIEALNFALLNKKLSRNERHELLETKDRLVLLKEEYLGLILQDEFIGINRIFETINDSGLDDIKQKALEIENLLKLFFDSKNNEAGDLDEIISRTINNFNQDKLLETVKNSTDINFIQNSKIEAILTSFNLIKEYFIACDNFDKDKDFNKNFKFLDDRSTIEKSNYKIQFTTIGYIKELYYDLQMFVIKTVSFIVYRAYDILINKIVMPLFNFIADVLNYPVLVGHYGTVQEAQEYLENRKRILLYDQGVLSSDSSSDSEQDEANDAQLDEDLSNQGVVSWYWSQACSLAANYTPEIVSSTISGASQKVFGSKKQTA